MAIRAPLVTSFSSRPKTTSRIYKLRLARGLGLVLTYLRLHPGAKALSAKRVVQALGLEGRNAYTEVGLALRHLARLGLLVPWRTSRPLLYLVPQELHLWLEEHPCLSSCFSDSGVCGLYGTPRCPFMQGFSGGDGDG